MDLPKSIVEILAPQISEDSSKSVKRYINSSSSSQSDSECAERAKMLKAIKRKSQRGPQKDEEIAKAKSKPTSKSRRKLNAVPEHMHKITKNGLIVRKRGRPYATSYSIELPDDNETIETDMSVTISSSAHPKAVKNDQKSFSPHEMFHFSIQDKSPSPSCSRKSLVDLQNQDLVEITTYSDQQNSPLDEDHRCERRDLTENELKNQDIANASITQLPESSVNRIIEGSETNVNMNNTVISTCEGSSINKSKQSVFDPSVSKIGTPCIKKPNEEVIHEKSDGNDKKSSIEHGNNSQTISPQKLQEFTGKINPSTIFVCNLNSLATSPFGIVNRANLHLKPPHTPGQNILKPTSLKISKEVGKKLPANIGENAEKITSGIVIAPLLKTVSVHVPSDGKSVEAQQTPSAKVLENVTEVSSSQGEISSSSSAKTTNPASCAKAKEVVKSSSTNNGQSAENMMVDVVPTTPLQNSTPAYAPTPEKMVKAQKTKPGKKHIENVMKPGSLEGANNVHSKNSNRPPALLLEDESDEEEVDDWSETPIAKKLVQKLRRASKDLENNASVASCTRVLRKRKRKSTSTNEAEKSSEATLSVKKSNTCPSKPKSKQKVTEEQKKDYSFVVVKPCPRESTLPMVARVVAVKKKILQVNFYRGNLEGELKIVGEINRMGKEENPVVEEIERDQVMLSGFRLTDSNRLPSEILKKIEDLSSNK